MSDYFVKVQDAKTLRKRVLEASKGSINILRSYHYLRDVRQQKIDMIEQLKQELKELSLLVNMVSDNMPTLSKSDVKAIDNLEKMPKRRLSPDERHVFAGRPEKGVPPPQEPEKKQEQPTRKQDLHEKLAAIERKLSRL